MNLIHLLDKSKKAKLSRDKKALLSQVVMLFITAQAIRISVIAGSLPGSRMLDKIDHIMHCKHD